MFSLTSLSNLLKKLERFHGKLTCSFFQGFFLTKSKFNFSSKATVSSCCRCRTHHEAKTTVVSRVGFYEVLFKGLFKTFYFTNDEFFWIGLNQKSLWGTLTWSAWATRTQLVSEKRASGSDVNVGVGDRKNRRGGGKREKKLIGKKQREALPLKNERRQRSDESHLELVLARLIKS